MVESLRADGMELPLSGRTMPAAGQSRPAEPNPAIQINCDNSTSDKYTILDIFTDHDGLLYAIARTLFELDLPIWRAKAATYLDQAVDVFYVSDRQNRKIKDQQRLDEISRRLAEVITALERES